MSNLKRHALVQGGKDGMNPTWDGAQGDTEQKPQRATQAQMAGRKIAGLKSKRARPANGSSNVPLPATNPFASTPSFNFGASSNNDSSSNGAPAPSFGFGASTNGTANTAPSSGLFSFGASNSTPEPPASSTPSFSFNAGSTPSFGSTNNTNNTSSSAPSSFTFGASAQPSQPTATPFSTTPSFSFGGSADTQSADTGSKSLFTFNSAPAAPAPSTTFSTTPSFSFGASSTTEKKPEESGSAAPSLFTFGGGGSSTPAPKPSFGAKTPASRSHTSRSRSGSPAKAASLEPKPSLFNNPFTASPSTSPAPTPGGFNFFGGSDSQQASEKPQFHNFFGSGSSNPPSTPSQSTTAPAAEAPFTVTKPITFGAANETSNQPSLFSNKLTDTNSLNTMTPTTKAASSLFGFVPNKKTEDSKSTGTSDAAKDASAEKPALSFGSGSASTFSFGKPAQPDASSNTDAAKASVAQETPSKPASSGAPAGNLFSFTKPAAKPDGTSASATPGNLFSFGKPAEKTGETAESTKPPVTFGTNLFAGAKKSDASNDASTDAAPNAAPTPAFSSPFKFDSAKKSEEKSTGDAPSATPASTGFQFKPTPKTTALGGKDFTASDSAKAAPVFSPQPPATPQPPKPTFSFDAAPNTAPPKVAAAKPAKRTFSEAELKRHDSKGNLYPWVNEKPEIPGGIGTDPTRSRSVKCPPFPEDVTEDDEKRLWVYSWKVKRLNMAMKAKIRSLPSDVDFTDVCQYYIDRMNEINHGKPINNSSKPKADAIPGVNKLPDSLVDVSPSEVNEPRYTREVERKRKAQELGTESDDNGKRPKSRGKEFATSTMEAPAPSKAFAFNASSSSTTSTKPSTSLFEQGSKRKVEDLGEESEESAKRPKSSEEDVSYPKLNSETNGTSPKFGSSEGGSNTSNLFGNLLNKTTPSKPAANTSLFGTTSSPSTPTPSTLFPNGTSANLFGGNSTLTPGFGNATAAGNNTPGFTFSGGSGASSPNFGLSRAGTASPAPSTTGGQSVFDSEEHRRTPDHPSNIFAKFAKDKSSSDQEPDDPPTEDEEDEEPPKKNPFKATPAAGARKDGLFGRVSFGSPTPSRDTSAAETSQGETSVGEDSGAPSGGDSGEL